MKVAASGGTSTVVTRLGSRYTTHRWPEFVPDGKHFLFLAANHDTAKQIRPAIFWGSLDGAEPRLLVEADSNARYVSGRLLFVSGGELLSQPFDAAGGNLEASATILALDIEYDPALWHATFAATSGGLVYRAEPQTPAGQRIEWFDRSGKLLEVAGEPGPFRGVSLSPDGKTVAVAYGDPDENIWLVNPDKTLTRLTDAPINERLSGRPTGASLFIGRTVDRRATPFTGGI